MRFRGSKRSFLPRFLYAEAIFAGETRFRESRWSMCCSFLLLEIVICKCDEEKRVQVDAVFCRWRLFVAGGIRFRRFRWSL